MKVRESSTVGYTTRATIVADEGEVLTKEAIEERYFQPFGGVIIGMCDTIAHVHWYND